MLNTDSWNMVDATVLSALVANDATLGTLDDLSVVRASLEGVIARDAAARRTPGELERLREALVRMRYTIEDEPRFNEQTMRAHILDAWERPRPPRPRH